MSSAKKDKPDHSQLPNNYIFSGYYKKGKLVTKVKTIPNLLVFAEDPNAACHVEGEPIVLRTNENGVLHGLSLNKKTLLASEMPYSHKFDEKGEPIILNAAFPPMEAAAYLALKHGVNWQQEFIKAMKDFKGNEAKPNKLKLEKIKYSQLEKPDNKETEYKKWHSKFKDGDNFFGYVVPKTRGIFFVFSNNEIAPKLIKSIKVRIPGKSKTHEILPPYILISKNEEFHIAMLTGTEFNFPNGMYEITVHLNKISDEKEKKAGNENITILSDKDKWSGNVVGNEATAKQDKNSYTLSTMVRFDYVIPGGEFSLIMCDPISLEESLITQFPTQYAHLIEAGIKYKTEASKEVIPAGKPVSNGMTTFVKTMGLTKSFTDLTMNVGKLDSRSAAAWLLGEQLNTHLSDDNQLVNNVVNFTFAWRSYTGTADKFVQSAIDARKALAKAAPVGQLNKAKLKNYIKNWGNVEPKDFKLAEAYQISDDFIKGLGKISAVLDVVNTVTSVTEAGMTVSTASNNREIAVNNLQEVVDHYIKITKYEEFEEVIIKVKFSAGSATVSDEDTAELETIALDLIKHDIPLQLNGYTDSTGTDEYNHKLSQDRADAVKKILIDNFNVNEKLIMSCGLGKAIANSDDEDDKDKINNRRVSSVYTRPAQKGAPCREGIQSCERYRNQSVLAQLKLIDSYYNLAEKCIDSILLVLSVIPITAPAALAISLTKASSGVVKAGVNAAINLADAVHFDGLLRAYINEAEQQEKMYDESKANQSLLSDLLVDSKLDSKTMPVAQFRIRAEAINGLINLILRAKSSVTGSNKDLSDQLEKYKVKQYIQNFILNDRWVYPIKSFSSMTMDQMWLFAINPHNIRDIDSKGKPTTQNTILMHNFGFDPDFRLMSVTEILASHPARIIESTSDSLANTYNSAMNLLGDTAEKVEFDGSDLRQSGTQMMTLSNNFLETDILSNFHQLYPIHHFDSESIEILANSFKISWPELNKNKLGIYKHTAIYIWKNNATKSDPAAGKWVLLVDPSKRKDEHWESDIQQLNPFTKIKVVLIFNEIMVKGYVPVKLELHRVDDLNVEGPTYKSITKLIQKRDIEGLTGLDEYVGKNYGCIIEPFYQFSNATIFGIKPMIPTNWKVNSSLFKGFHYSNIDEYHNSNNMNEMRYSFKAIVGKNTNTELWVPIMADTYDCDENENRSKHSTNTTMPGHASIEFNKEIDNLPNEIKMKLDGTKYDQARLLIPDFLTNNSSDKPVLGLFDDEISVVPLIRIGGKNNPWVSPKGVGFESDYKKYTDVSIEDYGDELKINNFSWSEEVEFAFVLSCNKLKLDSYVKAKRSPYTISGSVTLSEGDNNTWTSEINGPVLTGLNFEYVGRADKRDFKYLEKPAYKNNLPTSSGGDSEKLKLKTPRTPRNYKNIKDIIKIMQENNKPEYYEQFYALNNCPDWGLFNNNHTRYYYVAYTKMKYVSPKGKEVNSIRPFGKDKVNFKTGSNDEGMPKDKYFEYTFINFSTEEGYSKEELNNTYRTYYQANDLFGDGTRKANFIKNKKYRFHFSAPTKKFTESQPWTKPMEKEDLIKVKSSLFYEDSADATNKIKLKDAKTWLQIRSQDLSIALKNRAAKDK